MARCFIAIPFPPEVVERIAAYQRRLQKTLSGLRWAPPHNLHLTLRFLGEQREDSLEKLAAVVLSVGRSSAPFRLTLAGLGAFPSWARARVVWLALDTPPPLGVLYRELSTALERFGLSPEQRPFHPHVTLGRCRSRPLRLPELAEDLQTLAVADLIADQMTLFRSRLTRAGAIHTPLVTAKFGESDIFCQPAGLE